MKDLLKAIKFGVVAGFFMFGVFYILLRFTDLNTFGDKNSNVSYLSKNYTNKNSGLKILIYTGTTAMSGDSIIAHGLNGDSIVGLNCYISNSTDYLSLYSWPNSGSGKNLQSNLFFNDTSIIMSSSNSKQFWGGKPYKCTVFYTE